MSSNIQKPITFSVSEARKLQGKADKAGLSFSNLVRSLIGFPILKKGAPKGNQYARGNKSRHASKGKGARKSKG